MDYEEFERRCEAEKARNEQFLDIFRSDLTASGLSRKAVDDHIDNVSSFLNWYAVEYKDCIPMEQALKEVSSFLTYFVPGKYIGNTKNLVRKNATSLKKFYSCMVDHGYISKSIFEAEQEWINEAADDAGKTYKTLLESM